jgi:hypothetical protein
VILERLQRLDIIVGQDVPAQAQGLTEFDERRPEPCQGQAQPLRRSELRPRQIEPPRDPAELEPQELKGDAEQAE